MISGEQKLLNKIVTHPFEECITFWRRKKEKELTGSPKFLGNAKQVQLDFRQAKDNNLLESPYYSRRYMKLTKLLNKMSLEELNSFINRNKEQARNSDFGSVYE